MVAINVVYYFGYCRTVPPCSPLRPPLPSPPLPPPDGSVFIAVRRDARSNPCGRSIYLLLLLLATGIDPIDRQQPAVFIFIGIVDSTEKKKKKKKPAKLQQQPTYIEAMHVPSSRPWNSKFARHKHDHYAYKRSMQIEVSNRCRKATRSMYTVIYYSAHIYHFR